VDTYKKGYLIRFCTERE